MIAELDLDLDHVYKMSRDTKKCIKDFVQHVDSLEAENDPEGNGFNREYRLIHEVQVRNRRENMFQMTAGKADNNLKKNRYKDILPYDEHRVLLSVKEGEENSDYINASRMMGVKGTGGYIASQGPLASTVDDFWRMIWECNVEIVFMACKIVELGKIKCKQYWNDVDKSDSFGEIEVFTEAEEEIGSDFIHRKFRVTRNGEERNVIQFHYRGWPDHGIPDDPAHIRDLISIVRQTRKNDQAPLLVHCSAGCGRTGAIVAIDFVWTLLEHGRFDETFSLYDLICSFREQRMSMVQTADQYALVNKVLRTLCEEWLDKMASHTYVNVELKSTSDTGDNGKTGNYENRVIMESSNGPKMSTEPSQGNLSGHSPNLPPPSYMAPQPPSGTGPSSSNYQNVVLLPDRTPVSKGTQPDDDSNKSDKVTASNGNKQETRHMTVIQLGSGAASTSTSKSTGSLGGPNQVINLVRGGSTKSTSSTSPGTSLGATPPTSPAAPVIPDWQRRQQEFDDSPIYATVNKGGRKLSPAPTSSNSKNSPPAAGGTPATRTNVSKGNSSAETQPRMLADSSGYSLVEFHDGGVSAGSGNASRLDSSSNTTYSLAQRVPLSSDPYSLAQRVPLSRDPYSLAKDVPLEKDPYSLAELVPSNSDTYSLAKLVHSNSDTYSLAAQVTNGSAANSSSSRALHSTGGAGSVNSGRKVLNGPGDAGFGERLPRVKGPVPPPQSWKTAK
ncbi:hypothetical protein RRG08_038152 [Elysia crispata]|uniref:protein-tyrosine-phosphatase n=1 Tax=Elysia crispata TaxID=231223 RepID=A0AAE1D4F6_9GAST|nr:hypothetical protein RRG08_038152 [Elysia crispata]